MTKKGLLRAMIFSGLMVFSQFGVPAYLDVARRVQAGVSVNISINSFYDDLADDGDWMWYGGRYVWVPEVVPRWRPYLYGHWVYTRVHGWYWVSDEPFGWAVYHYGRWAFNPAFGWYWVPGRRWAPAWVAWSHTDDDIGWAPLPPEYDDDDDEVNISISIGHLPVEYWNVVPVTAFALADVDRYVVHDRDYIHRVITVDEPETVVIQNNTVINNFIDVHDLENKTKRDIVVYEERSTERRETTGNKEQNTIAVFNPEVMEEPTAKPRKLKKTEEVVKRKRALRALQEEQLTEPGATPALKTDTDEAPPEDQDRRTKIRKKLQAQPEDQATEGKKRKKQAVGALEPNEQAVQEQPSKKRKKRLLQEQEISSHPAEEPVKKRKKKSAEEFSSEQPAEEPTKKRKKNAVEKSQQQMIDGAEEQSAKKKKRAAQARQETEEASQKQTKKKSKRRACDPQVEECPNTGD